MQDVRKLLPLANASVLPHGPLQQVAIIWPMSLIHSYHFWSICPVSDTVPSTFTRESPSQQVSEPGFGADSGARAFSCCVVDPVKARSRLCLRASWGRFLEVVSLKVGPPSPRADPCLIPAVPPISAHPCTSLQHILARTSQGRLPTLPRSHG